MICRYLPRVAVHPDRHGTRRTVPPRWIVVHTSEQSYESAGAAAQLAQYMTTPGDRPSSSGGRYGSSYHDVIDLDMVIRPAVPHEVVAFAAPGSNTEGLHVCLPARAGQSAGDWLDDYSRNQIRTLAGYIVDQATAYRIDWFPFFPLSPADLVAGRAGVTDHWRIGQAFGRTNHTDVGSAFPWDLLDNEISALTHPTTPPPSEQEEEPMQGIVAIYYPTEAVTVPNPKTFVLLPDGSVRHASGPDTGLDRPRIPILGLEHYNQCVELDAIWRSR
jgi:N-acetyl-anhydromuramyl-L-alanine amidase AmpD